MMDADSGQYSGNNEERVDRFQFSAADSMFCNNVSLADAKDIASTVVGNSVYFKFMFE